MKIAGDGRKKARKAQKIKTRRDGFFARFAPLWGQLGRSFSNMLRWILLVFAVALLVLGLLTTVKSPAWSPWRVAVLAGEFGHWLALPALAVLAWAIAQRNPTVLVLAALSIVTGAAQSTILNPWPHGLTELLYAYSSATGNNGSAFAGLNANVDWHNSWLGIAMLLGRYGYIIPILAIAGSLALKKTAPPSAGTFPTHGPVFVTLLVATILIIGALTFLPVLALGPIAEQVSIAAGQSF